jgi:GLPGLI family protein
MKKIILSAAILITSLAGISQIKEGKITYNVVGEGLPQEMAATMDGTEQIVTFKGNKSRIDIENAFLNMSIINDEKKVTVLTEQMGQKSYTEAKIEDVKKKEEENKATETQAVIEYKDETKKIAGYDCKKAVIKSKDEKGEENVTVVWHTDQLPYSGQGAARGVNKFKGLKGAPLEYEAKFGPFNMKFTATAVSKDPVADSKFVPNTDGYIKKSIDEIKKEANSAK